MQSCKLSPPTNEHPVFLLARCPSCRPTSSVKALEAINYVYKTNVTKMFPQTDVTKCSLLVLLYCKEQGLSHIDACSRLAAQCLNVTDHRPLSISVAQLLSVSLLSILTAIFPGDRGQPVATFSEAKDDGNGSDKLTTAAMTRAKLQ